MTSCHERDKLLPLVVDLDGTLMHTDSLHESAALAIRLNFLVIFNILKWMLRSPQYLKSSLAELVAIDVATLPYNAELLAYIRSQRAMGRRIVLATAADGRIAQAVARHLAVFDDVLASSVDCNLKGTRKLLAIKSLVGEKFVYAGDSKADIPIWISSSAAILVGASGKLRGKILSAGTPIEREFSGYSLSLRDWLSALRFHQWAKNALLFIPMLMAFSFSPVGLLGDIVSVFIAFSMVASAGYLFNDILDIQSDRAHLRKRSRKLASGHLSIALALQMGIFLLVVGMVIAVCVSVQVGLCLASYFFLTMSYSLVFKHYVLLDVILLAALYALRIFTGAVAINVVLSPWLLSFSMFLFFGLALVKRCAELTALASVGRLSATGRDYRVSDLPVLTSLGVGTAVAAAVVLGLFIMSPETQSRYGHPDLLWLALVGLMYWAGRLWIKTFRGEMHDDPVVYTLKDRGSRYLLIAEVAIILLARLLPT